MFRPECEVVHYPSVRAFGHQFARRVELGREQLPLGPQRAELGGNHDLPPDDMAARIYTSFLLGEMTFRAKQLMRCPSNSQQVERPLTTAEKVELPSA